MNYIFDFDGTIADSLEAGVKIVNRLLKEEGKTIISKDDVRNKGIRYIIKTRNLSKLTIFTLLLKARAEISKHIEQLSCFDSLPTVIRKLSKKNKLGIISSNSKENIKLFLKRHRLLNNFAFINDGKDWFGKHKKILKTINKYNLSSKDTIYIGDEGRDIVAAKKSGIKAVAVTWGFENKKILQQYQPDAIIKKPSDFLTLKF